MDTSRTVSDLEAPASQPARLQVAGVQTPILTQVTRKSARGMTVEQALPFLQLRTQVWDDAQQSSRIESVSVVVYDGVPRLVLDLAYDEAYEDAPGPVAQLEAAAPVAEPRRAHAGVVRPRVREDQTASYEREPRTSSSAAAERAAGESGTGERAMGERGTVPYGASRESTQVFSTQAPTRSQTKAEQLPLAVSGLKLSVMEQELLQPKDWVYHVRTNWERAQPHLRRAGWQAQAWSFRAYRWAQPRAIRLFFATRALAQRGARATADYMARKRAQRAAAKLTQAASQAPAAQPE